MGSIFREFLIFYIMSNLGEPVTLAELKNESKSLGLDHLFVFFDADDSQTYTKDLSALKDFLEGNLTVDLGNVTGDSVFNTSVTINDILNIDAPGDITFTNSGQTLQQIITGIEGDVSNNTSAISDLDAAVVKLTGDQTISGVKTFSNGIIVPNPEDIDFSGDDSNLQQKLDSLQTNIDNIDLSDYLSKSIGGTMTGNVQFDAGLNVNNLSNIYVNNYNGVGSDLDSIFAEYLKLSDGGQVDGIIDLATIGNLYMDGTSQIYFSQLNGGTTLDTLLGNFLDTTIGGTVDGDLYMGNNRYFYAHSPSYLYFNNDVNGGSGSLSDLLANFLDVTADGNLTGDLYLNSNPNYLYMASPSHIVFDDLENLEEKLNASGVDWSNVTDATVFNNTVEFNANATFTTTSGIVFGDTKTLQEKLDSLGYIKTYTSENVGTGTYSSVYNNLNLYRKLSVANNEGALDFLYGAKYKYSNYSYLHPDNVVEKYQGVRINNIVRSLTEIAESNINGEKVYYLIGEPTLYLWKDENSNMVYSEDNPIGSSNPSLLSKTIIKDRTNTDVDLSTETIVSYIDSQILDDHNNARRPSVFLYCDWTGRMESADPRDFTGTNQSRDVVRGFVGARNYFYSYDRDFLKTSGFTGDKDQLSNSIFRSLLNRQYCDIATPRTVFVLNISDVNSLSQTLKLGDTSLDFSTDTFFSIFEPEHSITTGGTTYTMLDGVNYTNINGSAVYKSATNVYLWKNDDNFIVTSNTSPASVENRGLIELSNADVSNIGDIGALSIKEHFHSKNLQISVTSTFVDSLSGTTLTESKEHKYALLIENRLKSFIIPSLGGTGTSIYNLHSGFMGTVSIRMESGVLNTSAAKQSRKIALISREIHFNFEKAQEVGISIDTTRLHWPLQPRGQTFHGGSHLIESIDAINGTYQIRHVGQGGNTQNLDGVSFLIDSGGNVGVGSSTYPIAEFVDESIASPELTLIKNLNAKFEVRGNGMAPTSESYKPAVKVSGGDTLFELSANRDLYGRTYKHNDFNNKRVFSSDFPMPEYNSDSGGVLYLNWSHHNKILELNLVDELIIELDPTVSQWNNFTCNILVTGSASAKINFPINDAAAFVSSASYDSIKIYNRAGVWRGLHNNGFVSSSISNIFNNVATWSTLGGVSSGLSGDSIILDSPTNFTTADFRLSLDISGALREKSGGTSWTNYSDSSYIIWSTDFNDQNIDTSHYYSGIFVGDGSNRSTAYQAIYPDSASSTQASLRGAYIGWYKNTDSPDVIFQGKFLGSNLNGDKYLFYDHSALAKNRITVKKGLVYPAIKFNDDIGWIPLALLKFLNAPLVNESGIDRPSFQNSYFLTPKLGGPQTTMLSAKTSLLPYDYNGLNPNGYYTLKALSDKHNGYDYNLDDIKNANPYRINFNCQTIESLFGVTKSGRTSDIRFALVSGGIAENGLIDFNPVPINSENSVIGFEDPNNIGDNIDLRRSTITGDFNIELNSVSI